MIRERTLRARQKLVGKLPITGELLRGSLLERTIRHTKGCPKCARGEGHHVFVLTVTYPGGRTRQLSVRRERVRDSLAGFLRHAVETATEEGSAPGCLLVCVAPLVDDAEVRLFLKDVVAGGVALVKRRFCDAISAGEVPSDFPVAVRASQGLDLSRGLTMRAQMGTPRKELLKDAEEAADL